ncbi:hypothetical protein Vqi01_34700 [Micromonospora qiuiae]|uniref:DUF1707 domain-containing protein n=1 Tax=Micromonospora qiuiae TaxID=502268 RepID=A0ABQ4JDX4_9ACTN|nr:hypothetical protein [Micromonospora qiuiae]GIJ28308.1 hypothetical protein Vqi01_34700 [Micromonospora qiuiae]
MTTPNVLDMTALLDRYKAGLRDVTDAELERRAVRVAALPGRLADGLRHLVDAERERRQAARQPVSPAARSRVALAAAGAAAAGAPVAVFAGRAFAEYADHVPQALVYSPAVAVGLVAVAVGGGRLARWVDDRRHPLAVDVDEAGLDPLGKELLARVRAQRLVRGEVFGEH